MNRDKLHIKISSIILALLFLLHFSTFVTAEESSDADSYNGYLISLPDGPPLRSIGSGSGELSYVAKGIYLTEDYDFAQRLLSVGMAEYVEANYQLMLFSDEVYDWSYKAVGGDTAHTFGIDGTGVRIAIIDSGLDADNANLTGAKIAGGYDYLANTTDMTDDVGHGTYISQVIAGSGDGGVTGAARGAEIIPLRCFSGNTGDVASAIRAIYDAVDVYNCSVINISWGLKQDSSALHTAIQYAYDADVVLIAAAGNVSSEYPQGTLLYPAAYDHVIGVGAVDSSYTVVDYSMQTEAVTVCAPGSDISFKHFANDSTVTSSSTSFAASYVAAEAALLRQLSPWMTNAEIVDLMTDRAEDLGDEGYDLAYGYGFVSMESLLGKPWYRMEIKDDTVTIDGWYCGGEDGYIVAAVYDEDGKMCACSATGTTDVVTNIHIDLPSCGSALQKLFIVDTS